MLLKSSGKNFYFFCMFRKKDVYASNYIKLFKTKSCIWTVKLINQRFPATFTT